MSIGVLPACIYICRGVRCPELESQTVVSCCVVADIEASVLWKISLCSPEEQPELSTAEPSLQPDKHFFMFVVLGRSLRETFRVLIGHGPQMELFCFFSVSISKRNTSLK